MGFFGNVSVDVAVDFAGGAENDGRVVGAAIFQDVVGHGDILQRAIGLLHELVDFGVGGEMNDNIELTGVFDVADAVLEGFVGRAEVLQEGLNLVGPGVLADIHPENVMAFLLEFEAEVGAYLTAGTCDEYAHSNFLVVLWEMKFVLL